MKIFKAAMAAGFRDAGDTGVWIRDGYYDKEMAKFASIVCVDLIKQLNVWKDIAVEEMGEGHAVAEFNQRIGGNVRNDDDSYVPHIEAAEREIAELQRIIQELESAVKRVTTLLEWLK